MHESGRESADRSQGRRVRGVGRADPSEVVALVLALEEREQQDERDRRRLDREIGARHGDRNAARGLTLLRRWLAEAPGPSTRERIERVAASLSLFRWLLVAVGAFLGWAAASALLRIEMHAGRINIVLCLGLLVLLPLVMLAFACLGAAWSLRPGAAAGGTRGGWRRFGLARLAMRLVSPSVRDDLEILLGRFTAHAQLYGRVQRAQLLVWSQWLGLAFSGGALVATLLFVVFTDLAFGWSTTLDVEAELVHRLARTAATPWTAIWPAASPSLELVEATRHFRLASDDHTHAIDPILFGGWWPFLVMSLLFYALVPRALTTGFMSLLLSRESARAIALTPGVERLLERLTTPLIESQAPRAEGALGRTEPGLVSEVEAREWLRREAAAEPLIVRWAAASDDRELAALLGSEKLQIRDAGGRRNLAQDAELVRASGAATGGVALCVRAFEPPVLDVLDFLSELRRAIGSERGLAVFLMGGDADDHDAWRHKLASLGDPHLVVARLETGRV